MCRYTILLYWSLHLEKMKLEIDTQYHQMLLVAKCKRHQQMMYKIQYHFQENLIQLETHHTYLDLYMYALDSVE